jgi:hypothetical protein
MKELLIICNGASLRNFDFNNIDRDKYDVMTLGLAYRYFHKIRFNFEYYVCVDTVVLKHNEWEICRMIKRNLLKNCMISARASFDVETLNKLKRHQAKVSVLETYRENEQHPLARVEKWTTGSCAILYGIGLGYRKIKIIGLDCDYTMIDNYIEREDGTLEVNDTIVDNPNYFFDEYQREGDIFNRPNNIPNLHTDAIIEALNIAKDEGVKIHNYNDKPSFRDYVKTSPYKSFK